MSTCHVNKHKSQNMALELSIFKNWKRLNKLQISKFFPKNLGFKNVNMSSKKTY